MKEKKLAELGEVDAIKKILNSLSSVIVKEPCLPIDDDVQAIDGCKLAVKIDGYSEGISRYPWEDPSDWGWRAVTGPISDLSAKGYKTVGVVYSLGAPGEERFEKIKKVVRGIREALEYYGVPFLGGDLNSSSRDVWMDVAALGILSAPYPVPRNGAKPGESVYTTLQNGYGKPGLLYKFFTEKSWHQASPKLLKFRPKAVVSFPKLISTLQISSSMDSSDGLAKTLKTIAERSRISIELRRLPITRNMKKTLKKYSVDIERAVLFGGEEYEIVFTTSEDETKVRDSCKEIGISCVKIGDVVEGAGRIYYRGTEVTGGGWDQFKGQEV